MQLIKPKLEPLNISKLLKELLRKHRNKQRLFTQKDYGLYYRLTRLAEFNRKEVMKQNIYTYLTLTVICIACILLSYASLYLIDYIIMK